MMNKKAIIVKYLKLVVFCAAIALCLAASTKDANASTVKKVGDYYYGYDDNGSTLSGWNTINGYKYYFNSKGRAATGVKTIGSYMYYFSDSGKMTVGPAYKKVVQGDTTYYLYLNSAGRSSKGIKKIPGKDYSFYFYGDGRIAQNKLLTIDDSYYFFGTSGVMVTDSMKKVGSYYYYFGSDGKAVTGWNTIGKYKYYFNSKCRAFANCVKKIGSYYYYFDEYGRVMVNKYKKVEINSVTYYAYANSLGRFRTGLLAVPGTDYSMYFNGDGTIVSNAVKEIGGELYFFGTSGKIVTDAMKQIDGYYYYFGNDGKAVTGWKTIGDYKYYFKSDKRAVTDEVKQIGSDIYYFNASGRVQTGYKVIGESKYYFDENGRSASGVFQIPSKEYSYYFNGDGTILKSAFKTIDGKLYFFTKDGILFKGDWRNAGTIDFNSESLYIHADPETGVIAQGKTTFTRTSDGAVCTYFFDRNVDNGYRTGLIEADGQFYYFEEKGNIGYLEKGFYTDKTNNSTYFFDYQSGEMLLTGSAVIEGTNVSFAVGENGVLDIAGGVSINESDTNVDKLIKYSFSQLFKPSMHTPYSQLMPVSLDQVAGYNCSGFVMRMFKEVEETDIFNKDNDLIKYLVENNKSITADQSAAKTGDIVFFNLESCATIDDEGNPWTIDSDGDGKCDRIHEDIVVGSNRAHIHHVGIYIGHGQVINSVVAKGVMVTTLSTQCHDDFQVYGYGRIYE